MVRILVSYVIPLLLPTMMYFIWTAWVRKQIAAKHAKQTAFIGEGQTDADEITADEVEAFEIRTPWFRLILAGAGLVLLGLVLGVFFGPQNPPDSVYQAPRIENGKVVPGQFAPKPQ
jgi:hypothetical protein